MEKKKLKLDDLKVQSFVTEFDKTQGQTQEVQGGSFGDYSCFIITCGWATCANTCGSCNGTCDDNCLHQTKENWPGCTVGGRDCRV